MIPVHASHDHPVIAFYAQFYGEAGYAIRTQNHRVLFVDHDAQGVLLTHADIPVLVLCGQVDLADAQHLADVQAGGAAAIACTRLAGVA